MPFKGVNAYVFFGDRLDVCKVFVKGLVAFLRLVTSVDGVVLLGLAFCGWLSAFWLVGFQSVMWITFVVSQITLYLVANNTTFKSVCF